MKAATQQLNLGLRLVVPVTAAPGPRSSGGGLLWRDHDAPPLSARRASNAGSFPLGRLEGCEAKVGTVHHEVVAVEPTPGGPLTLERDFRGFGGAQRCDSGCECGKQSQTGEPASLLS